MQKAEETTNVPPESPTLTAEDIKEKDVTEEEQIPKLTELQQAQAQFILDFAKENYKRIVVNHQIKINGKFYQLVNIPEELEEEFSKRESATQKGGEIKKRRQALYDFLTFGTNITEAELKLCDRGELRQIAMIVGLCQEGFRKLQ